MLGNKHAALFAKKLRKARDETHAHIKDSFAVIVDVSDKHEHSLNQLLDFESPYFRKLMGKWRGSTDDTPRDVRIFQDLEHLPCILILCEKGKVGDRYPRSLQYYDLRLRYNEQPGASNWVATV